MPVRTWSSSKYEVSLCQALEDMNMNMNTNFACGSTGDDQREAKYVNNFTPGKGVLGARGDVGVNVPGKRLFPIGKKKADLLDKVALNQAYPYVGWAGLHPNVWEGYAWAKSTKERPGGVQWTPWAPGEGAVG